MMVASISAQMMSELGRREITSLFVEGGGTVLGSLFDDGLVDRVIGFIAPVIVGGIAAPSPVSGVGSWANLPTLCGSTAFASNASAAT